jgi:hypothetical protein
MKARGWMAGFLLLCLSLLCLPLAAALGQSGADASDNERLVPRLGDIMNAAQSRHIKLWLAGRAANWELAAFELRQLKAGLVQAAMLYSGIPVSNVTTLAAPLQSVADAIDARDGRRFTKAVGELTDGCNACHQSMGRAFVVIRIPVPAEQPFSDQIFAPKGNK